MSAHPTGQRVRHAARAIILTPAREILLMRMRFPWRDTDVWILPGGGREHDETPDATVRREVFEETGATEINIIGEAWRREFRVEATGVTQKQRYFLVESNRFEPRPTALLGPEGDWLREYRWWHYEQLGSIQDPVEPEQIASAVSRLITDGLPPRWIDLDADPVQRR